MQFLKLLLPKTLTASAIQRYWTTVVLVNMASCHMRSYQWREGTHRIHAQKESQETVCMPGFKTEGSRDCNKSKEISSQLEIDITIHQALATKCFHSNTHN